MKPLPVVAHLPHEEVGRRYRGCKDAKEKTRWHLVWLLLRPGAPACCEQAAPLVGLSDVHARAVLRRWNAHGPDGLADRRKVARNTVLTMITRLEEKGWLCRDDAGHAFRYRAAVPREATLGTMIRRLVDTAFGGSAEGLVLALLHGRGVSKEEARRIRTMIERAEGKKP